ncbi:cytochrome c oxidase assembly protein CtaG/Cox11-domain-containing protein [Mycotypha africana]|uniref:cytochrome c oxidase assembly protein CtaG/Cox11-domain-containing protein n=1 Tax=Mycotypha africana TaxID=64632 RepID=UPI0023016570|nr:cytochrome c oxidase assembly protein CtaG/Cox11-domain-containing protein [Mycotypha africana]KAI8967719.1 cytochrome c oxidase assembly protein CtaG/Cox11-domain-containing protein [Mycotypha africana]
MLRPNLHILAAQRVHQALFLRQPLKHCNMLQSLPTMRPIARTPGTAQRAYATISNTVAKPEKKKWSKQNISAGMYTASIFIAMLGMSYAAVPLYRLFCASTGYSGTPQIDKARFGAERLVPKTESKRIRVTFESNTSDTLPWTFKPEVREVYVVPGETALTFYKAKSKAKEDVIGIATYNVTPYRAASYFNKIQCFCFEEQKLKPGEDVDMPVFFFIDPDILDDPLMKDVNTITLSYTFFNSKYAKGLQPVQPAATPALA